VYGVREELAANIEDVISRRMGLQYYSWRDAIKAAPVVGYLMAQELNWTSAQEHEAVTRYVERINFFLERAGLHPEPDPAGRSSAA
jgi:glycerol-3-phosphate dehydrogenase